MPDGSNVNASVYLLFFIAVLDGEIEHSMRYKSWSAGNLLRSACFVSADSSSFG